MTTKIIEVFKTNVKSQETATIILNKLSRHFPQCKINFDLEDCDNILRVEGNNIKADELKKYIFDLGYYCEELE